MASTANAVLTMILFFGAEFTRVYAGRHGRRIMPSEFAVSVANDAGKTDKPAKPLN